MDPISVIYSGLCINIKARFNVVVIILSYEWMTWPLHVDLYEPHEVNGSPFFNGPHTNFSGITDYIFVEKTAPVQGLHVLSL